MKRILFILMAIFCLLSGGVLSASAAFVPSLTKPQIGVLIIGTADYKTDDFYNNIKSKIASANPTIDFKCGSDVQSQYEAYLLSKGIITDAPKPTVDDLYAFTKYGNYDQTLYLVIESSVTEKTKQSELFSTTERSRVNLEVKAILTDDNHVIKVVDSVADDTSKTSDLRAKREAFGKCMVDIQNQMKDNFIKHKTL